MNRSTKEFVQHCAVTLPIAEPIYEFGSRQMPGQEVYADLRPFFSGKHFVGADYIDGPGVDVVLDLHNIDLPANCVGTVICMEVLEHVELPFQAINEIYRIMKPGGLLILSAPMKLRIHGSPYDYWRFTPQGFKTLLQKFDQSFVGYCGDKEFPDKIVAIAVKQNQINIDDFLNTYYQWQYKWTNRWQITARKLFSHIKPVLPAILTDSTFELWTRQAENKQYRKWRNFVYFCVPPLLISFYKAIKRNE